MSYGHLPTLHHFTHTYPFTAPGVVSGPTVVTSSDSTSVISWSPPQLNNGRLTGYTLSIVQLLDYGVPVSGSAVNTSVDVTGMSYPWSQLSEYAYTTHPVSGFNSVCTQTQEYPTRPASVQSTHLVLGTSGARFSSQQSWVGRDVIWHHGEWQWHHISLYPVPSVAPMEVMVSRSADGLSMNISWSPLTLSQARGFVDYVITYGPPGSIKRQTLSNFLTTNGTFATLSSLDATRTYEVSVSGHTSAGEGPSSTLVTSSSPVVTALFSGTCRSI